jgi:putative N6-adenine-specific DNA methylase
MKLELIATSAFGLEAVVRREIEALGYKVTEREDGRITFVTNEEGLAAANIWLRSADRVLLKMGDFDALEFEDLFQGMQGLPWESLIPEDGNFIVDCTSVRSKLSSVPACQSVAEKGLIKRLNQTYGDKRFAKTGAVYNIKLRILKDRVTVAVDTSGPGLHKRGYRVQNVMAPIKETLAAAMVQLSFFKEGRLLVDPFCGSGTIAIEAAMIARNIAPGLHREFTAESWDYVPKTIWNSERAKAEAAVNLDADVRIYAYDIDTRAVQAAKENAGAAGVLDCIIFETREFAMLDTSEPASEERGIIVTNPPYGERIGEKEDIHKVYKQMKAFAETHSTWSVFLITTDKEFEALAFGRSADRRRKLYNGRLETTFYQYHGKK